MALCELRYPSDALGKQTACHVILPEKGTGPFATLYLLHGRSDDYTIWQRRTSIERYVENLPLIVVLPDGGLGWYSDAEQGFAYETALAVELVNRIERTFPAKPERAARAVAGLSMGGYGALKFAMKHPNRFAAAVSHSGAVGFGHRDVHWVTDPVRRQEFERILGPDPEGGPHDLYALAEARKTSGDLPALRIDCGIEDFLIEDNRSFRDHLTALGLPFEYQEWPGAHEWGYWDLHLKETLAFVKRELALPEAQKVA